MTPTPKDTNAGKELLHVDVWRGRPVFERSEAYAKFCLDLARMPAWKKTAYSEWTRQFLLFCTYEGARYRVTGASRLGDVWLAKDFEREMGYDLRVDVAKCSEWSNAADRTKGDFND